MMHWFFDTFRLLITRDRLERDNMNSDKFPARAPDARYVVIINSKDEGWTLNGSYGIHEARVPIEVAREARGHHIEKWPMWMPSLDYQIPPEFQTHAHDSFTAYWVAV